MKNKSSLKEIFTPYLELLIVLIIGLALFIYSSTVSFINNYHTTINHEYNSIDLYIVVIYELLALTIIILFLRKRKWTFKDFNFSFTPNMLFIALLLALIRYVLSYFFYQGLIISDSVSFEFAQEPEIVFDISFFSIILIVVVNSVFEEFILLGYLFKRLEQFNIVILISLSILIRLSFHTYQGIEEFPRVIILGLVLGVYYSKYKKLWPVILAHGIGNLIILLNYKFLWIR